MSGKPNYDLPPGTLNRILKQAGLQPSMCMMVYVASDYPLPTLAWDTTRPGFHVRELDECDEPVRQQFSKPCVYYVGSHEGCGCGFQYGEYEGCEEEADVVPSRQSRLRLTDFLTVALQHQSEVELFACWDGDQAAKPEYRERLRPGDLLRTRTFFRERELLVIGDEYLAFRDFSKE